MEPACAHVYAERKQPHQKLLYPFSRCEKIFLLRRCVYNTISDMTDNKSITMLVQLNAMSYKSKGKDRDHESSKSRNSVSGMSKGRDKERDRKSEYEAKERYSEKGSFSSKERHRSRSRERSSERRDGRRSSKDRHGRKHSRTRDDSRERDHRRRDHRERERRSRSRSRDRKHRSSGGSNVNSSGGSRDDRDHRQRSREHTEDSRRTVESSVLMDSPENYEYKSMEFTQNVISTMLLTAATASDFAKLLNSYNQQQQIQAQQQQIQTQQALFEQHNENSCSSVGSKGEIGATGSQALCNGNSSGGEGGESSRRRKKKSRWAGGDHDKTFIPGMPTVLPSTLTADQQEAYLVQLQIEEISRKLRTGDLMIPQNPEERLDSNDANNNEIKFLLLFLTYIPLKAHRDIKNRFTLS
uniref:Splicing factor 1 helix-hairpin domain-containing protein n=1 Tax=Anopheles culicifacies TaxID=139723 RepID=A0A182LT54_9DIPT